MFSILRLIRLPNLLMIALAQILVRYCIIMPAYLAEYHAVGVFPKHQSQIDFSLLVFSTILIAAAGYIINDVFDIYTDAINKPGKNIIGTTISAENGKRWFFLLSSCGILLAVYVAFKAEKLSLAFVQLFTAVSLYMYSSFYQRRFLAGNILIALLTALVTIVPALYEPEFYRNIIFVAIYSCFAFLLTIVREIIKDTEDLDGDEKSQYKTLPIQWGISRVKITLTFLVCGISILLFYFLQKYFYTNTVISFWNLCAICIIPVLALIYLVNTAEEKNDFHLASQYTKVLMLLGTLSMLPFYYFFLR